MRGSRKVRVWEGGREGEKIRVCVYISINLVEKNDKK